MEEMKNIKLLIADDHKLFRQGLASLLAAYPGFDEILEAADGQEMLKMVGVHKPDVVLLDLKMPIISGIQAMPVLHTKFPEVKVIVISMHTDSSYIATLIKEGASGYLPKGADVEEVVTAIRTVCTGKNYVNELVAEALIQSSRNYNNEAEQSESSKEITNEDKLLIRLIAQGLTSFKIGEILCQSKRTVDAHRRKLLKKIGVSNTAGITAYAIRHQIV